MASSSSNTSRLPLSKLQLAEQQRRTEEAAAVSRADQAADASTEPDRKPSPPPSRGRSPVKPGALSDRGVVRPRASSLPTKMPPPHLRSRSQSPQKADSRSEPREVTANTFSPPETTNQPATSASPTCPNANIEHASIDSSETLATQRTVSRGRVSAVDRILAELSYPRAVVKVVAEYNPTTREQLLCELKKEEARTKWQLTPPNRRRPVESLKNLLRKIEKEFGVGELIDEESEIVVDDIELLAKGRKLRKRIDEGNANRKMEGVVISMSNNTDMDRRDKDKGKQRVDDQAK